MAILLYLITRLAAAVAALMCIDVLAGTALAASVWNVLAAAGLLVILDIVVFSNRTSE